MEQNEAMNEVARTCDELGLWNQRLYCLKIMQGGGARPEKPYGFWLELDFKPLDGEQTRKILKAVREVAPEVIR